MANEMKTTNARILLKNDTEANWTKNDPMLLSGEFSYDTTNKYVKIGDGKSKWSDLDRIHVMSSDVVGLQGQLNTKTDHTVSTGKGNALIFNETTGGGAKIEDNTNKIWSFVGVNQADNTTNAYGSLYVIDRANNNYGPRLKMFKDGFTYSVGANLTEYNRGDEIATFKDIAGLSGTIHFRGVDNTFLSGDGTTIPNTKWYQDGNKPDKGDVIINATSTKEFIFDGEYSETKPDSGTWYELGDESTYATKDELHAAIAGLSAEEKTFTASETIASVKEDNGIITVTKQDIQIEMDQVTGLDDAIADAEQNAKDYADGQDAIVSAATVAEVVGENTDLLSADTVWGAKAYAKDLTDAEANRAQKAESDLLGPNTTELSALSAESSIYGVSAYVGCYAEEYTNNMFESGLYLYCGNASVNID